MPRGGTRASKAAAAEAAAETAMDAEPLAGLILLCRQVGSGKTSEGDALAELRQLRETHQRVPSLMLDALGTAELAVTEAEARSRLASFAQALSPEFIPSDLSQVFLESCAEASLQSRTVKLKTKLFFKQFKFNLAREESEGYAKLATELSADGEMVRAENVVGLKERLVRLIGQFNLDPNRVLDVLLSAAEASLPRLPFYLSLLKEFGASQPDIVALIGFRLTFYHGGGEETPESLYRLTAALLAAGLLTAPNAASAFEPLAGYLQPKADAIQRSHKEIVEDGRKRGKAAEKPSALAGAVGGVVGGLDSDSATAAATASTIGSAISNDDEATFVQGSKEALEALSLGRNQRLGLLWGLLGQGEISLALDLVERFPEFYPARCPAIAEQLCRLLHSLIQPLYCAKCPGMAGLESRLGGASVSGSEKAVEDWESFEAVVFPVLHLLGPHLATDPIVCAKVVRLVSGLMKEVMSEGGGGRECETYRAVVDLCDQVLLLALTAGECNPGLSEEIWSILAHFPYQVRYRLYGRWKNEHTARHPILNIRRGQVHGRTRYIMKRLSKETVKVIGRQVGKLAHTHPTVVFELILSKIQIFENLIGPVVDSLRYGLNSMELDVLGFSLIEELSNPEKEKLKVSDARLSPWLGALAAFAGAVYKRYAAGLELKALLEYVRNSLKTGKSLDLTVLREVVEGMSGTERTVGLTVEQLAAWTGGETLRAEGGYFSAKDKNTKRTTARLKESLMEDDTLVGSLAVLMGQQRSALLFPPPDKPQIHLKLCGQMLDECSETLSQFAGFLNANLKAEDYKRVIPSLGSLRRDYNLSWPTAFLLARPIYTAAIQARFEEAKRENKKLGIEKAGVAEAKAIAFRTALHGVVKDLAEEIRPLEPEKTWRELSPEAVVVFWLLTPYDVEVPSAAYEREAAKLRKEAAALDDVKDISESKRKKEKDRLLGIEAKLNEERKRQEEHVARVLSYLKHHGPEILASPSDATGRTKTIAQLLTLCLLPRAVASDLDALFSARFVAILHRLRLQNFYTLFVYDKQADCACLIQALSENEASHYGRFLCALLRQAQHWHSDQTVFDTECYNTPGFVTKLANAPAGEAASSIEYQNYRHLLHKWHWKITRACLLLLKSSSYVAIRNTFQVLIQMLPHFPLLTPQWENLCKAVEEVKEAEKEEREDLAVLATSYWGNLRLRKDKLVAEKDFHYVAPRKLNIPPLNATPPVTSGRKKSPPPKSGSAVAAPSSGSKAPPVKATATAKSTGVKESSSPPAKKAKEMKEPRRVVAAKADASPSLNTAKSSDRSASSTPQRQDATPTPASPAHGKPTGRKREAELTPTAANGDESTSKRSRRAEKERRSHSKDPPPPQRKATNSNPALAAPAAAKASSTAAPAKASAGGRSVVVPPPSGAEEVASSRKVLRLSKAAKEAPKTSSSSSRRK